MPRWIRAHFSRREWNPRVNTEFHGQKGIVTTVTSGAKWLTRTYPELPTKQRRLPLVARPAPLPKDNQSLSEAKAAENWATEIGVLAKPRGCDTRRRTGKYAEDWSDPEAKPKRRDPSPILEKEMVWKHSGRLWGWWACSV